MIITAQNRILGLGDSFFFDNACMTIDFDRWISDPNRYCKILLSGVLTLGVDKIQIFGKQNLLLYNS